MATLVLGAEKRINVTDVIELKEKNGSPRWSIREGKNHFAVFVGKKGQTECPIKEGMIVNALVRDFEVTKDDGTKSKELNWFVNDLNAVSYEQREADRDTASNVQAIKRAKVLQFAREMRELGITSIEQLMS
jgi:hypothetical protein